jgi:hypothetical protein
VASLRSSIPDIHPAGQVTINEWLSEMHDAADRRSAKKPVVHGEIAAS